MEESSSPEDSPQRRGEEEEEEDMPVKEIEEDIPLTKPGYPVPPAYPPIQVYVLVCSVRGLKGLMHLTSINNWHSHFGWDSCK